MAPITDDPRHKPRTPKWVWALVALCMVLVGAVGGLGAVSLMSSDEPVGAAPTSTTAAPKPTTTTTAPKELTDSELAAKFGNAVYEVEAETCEGVGFGSAFAIDKHHLVTNWHVVSEDASPTLFTRAGRQLNARVIHATEEPDVAVLKVTEPMSETLSFAEPGSLSEGQRIVALGYPLPEGDFTVAPGAITSFDMEGGGRAAARTDAAVDHGNSGGPALTMAGEVVGVVTAFDPRATQNVGLAYTEHSLRSGIDAALSGRGSVQSSSCDLALPTYEPEPSYEYEPPPSSPPPSYVPPTTTTIPCPTGSPTVVVDSVDATQNIIGFDVTIRGRVVNDASAAVAFLGVEGSFDIEESFFAITSTYGLAPGATQSWEATAFIEGDSPPTSATGRVMSPMWESAEHYDCPIG